MAYIRKKVRLGDALLEKRLITQKQLDEALSLHKERKIKIGEALIATGATTQNAINEILCEQLGIESVNLRKIEVDDVVFGMVSEDLIRKHRIVPFAMDDKRVNVIRVAMDDPQNIIAIDDVNIVTGMEVLPYLATPQDISWFIDKRFGATKAKKMSEAFKEQQAEYLEGAENDLARREDIDSSPIVQLVREIIEQAVRQRASDIHIEPYEDIVRIRYRVDGALREINNYEKTMYSAIVARIKVISGMDISEKRKPQDGRITIDVDHREYDIRVSNLPTVFGEKVVMRLASKEGFKKDKKELGMNEEDLKKFTDILKNPNGIILVTGPTGSGKSTTLYTALRELAVPEVNIITVEDPVEANVDGVNQVQVNPKADLTFASALRSILRQDPDIIMIGEIRDGETAGIAVKASITGHLVVSTLHTNSTAATVSRLVDMGVEPYLLGDSLVGIVAQRLVRRLCECKITRPATEEEKQKLGVPVDEEVLIKDPKPDGCPLCAGSGYFGRIGVYEIMPITRKLRNLINKRATADELTAAAQEEGMHTLRQSAARYVLDGVTSYKEMMKITYESDD